MVCWGPRKPRFRTRSVQVEVFTREMNSLVNESIRFFEKMVTRAQHFFKKDGNTALFTA